MIRIRARFASYRNQISYRTHMLSSNESFQILRNTSTRVPIGEWRKPDIEKFAVIEFSSELPDIRNTPPPPRCPYRLKLQ